MLYTEDFVSIGMVFVDEIHIFDEMWHFFICACYKVLFGGDMVVLGCLCYKGVSLIEMKEVRKW